MHWWWRLPCLVPDVSEKALQFSPCGGCQLEAFCDVPHRGEDVPPCPSLTEFPPWGGAGFGQMPFLHLLTWLRGFFCSLLIWWIIPINLLTLNQPYTPGIIPTWLWCVSLTRCWTRHTNVSLRVSARVFTRDAALWFSSCRLGLVLASG